MTKSKLSDLTAALERCWTAIRTVYPHTRPAIITVYLHLKGDRRGSYRQDSWTDHANDRTDEVHISSHILSEGPESVFQTLLHEACHSVAVARGIQDTSRQGRYHNYEFQRIAYELGLLTAQTTTVGWVTTSLAPKTMITFENALGELEDALTIWQENTPPPTPRTTTSRSNGMRAECPSCHRMFRISNRSFDFGPILCVPCGVAFEVDR